MKEAMKSFKEGAIPGMIYGICIGLGYFALYGLWYVIDILFPI